MRYWNSRAASALGLCWGSHVRADFSGITAYMSRPAARMPIPMPVMIAFHTAHVAAEALTMAAAWCWRFKSIFTMRFARRGKRICVDIVKGT
jgi:hypothetical protein